METSKSIIQVSEAIKLKPVDIDDAVDIFNTIDTQREYLGKWLPFVQYTNRVDDSKDFINSILDAPTDCVDYTFAIQFNGEFAGLIGFKGTDKANKKTEIGYWLSQPLQKQGIITQSVKALIKLAFEELEMNRIQIKCAVGNTPSKNIPRRLGFSFEGIERDGELLQGGVFTDIEVYSMLRRETNTV